MMLISPVLAAATIAINEFKSVAHNLHVSPLYSVFIFAVDDLKLQHGQAACGRAMLIIICLLRKGPRHLAFLVAMRRKLQELVPVILSPQVEVEQSSIAILEIAMWIYKTIMMELLRL